MKRAMVIVAAFLIVCTVARADNPFAGVTKEAARTDLKAFLEKEMGSNYTAIEAMLADGLKALESLKAVPSSAVNDKILADQKKLFYPNFTMILAMYQQDRAAYDRLQK